MIFLLLALLEQTPCPSPLAPKITPCSATSDDIIATLDGQPIRFGDLDENTRKEMDGLAATIANERKRAAREEVDDALLAREAERRKVTVGQLIYTEVMLKTARPAEEDVKLGKTADPVERHLQNLGTQAGSTHPEQHGVFKPLGARDLPDAKEAVEMRELTVGDPEPPEPLRFVRPCPRDRPPP